MLDGIATPIICATNLCNCSLWFVQFKEIMNHPLLKDDEKYLWMWLATQCANSHHLVCSFNYEQISLAVNKSPGSIHRSLFRLRTMGFLQGNIPIWYAPPSEEMIKEVRDIKVLIPPAYQEDVQGVILPMGRHRRGVELNLMKSKEREDKSLCAAKSGLSLYERENDGSRRSPLE